MNLTGDMIQMLKTSASFVYAVRTTFSLQLSGNQRAVQSQLRIRHIERIQRNLHRMTPMEFHVAYKTAA